MPRRTMVSSHGRGAHGGRCWLAMTPAAAERRKSRQFARGCRNQGSQVPDAVSTSATMQRVAARCPSRFFRHASSDPSMSERVEVVMPLARVHVGPMPCRSRATCHAAMVVNMSQGSSRLHDGDASHGHLRSCHALESRVQIGLSGADNGCG